MTTVACLGLCDTANGSTVIIQHQCEHAQNTVTIEVNYKTISSSQAHAWRQVWCYRNIASKCIVMKSFSWFTFVHSVVSLEAVDCLFGWY